MTEVVLYCCRFLIEERLPAEDLIQKWDRGRESVVEMHRAQWMLLEYLGLIVRVKLGLFGVEFHLRGVAIRFDSPPKQSQGSGSFDY